MASPFVVPLEFFAMVVLIVGIVSFAKLRDRELDVQERLRREEIEHQQKMKELQAELERVKQGA